MMFQKENSVSVSHKRLKAADGGGEKLLERLLPLLQEEGENTNMFLAGTRIFPKVQKQLSRWQYDQLQNERESFLVFVADFVAVVVVGPSLS